MRNGLFSYASQLTASLATVNKKKKMVISDRLCFHQNYFVIKNGEVRKLNLIFSCFSITSFYFFGFMCIPFFAPWVIEPLSLQILMKTKRNIVNAIRY